MLSWKTSLEEVVVCNVSTYAVTTVIGASHSCHLFSSQRGSFAAYLPFKMEFGVHGPTTFIGQIWSHMMQNEGYYLTQKTNILTCQSVFAIFTHCSRKRYAKAAIRLS